jgi:hypothetical protein
MKLTKKAIEEARGYSDTNKDHGVISIRNFLDTIDELESELARERARTATRDHHIDVLRRADAALKADLARQRERLNEVRLEEAEWWHRRLINSGHTCYQDSPCVSCDHIAILRSAILDRKESVESGAENPEPLSGDPPANSERSAT